jgi:excisionase family DNA binding protein
MNDSRRLGMPDEIMDIRSAAKYLQIKERTLYRLVGEGEIPGIKVGGQWRFSKKCLEGMFANEPKKIFHADRVTQ